MNIKAGDKVKFLNTVGGGIVTKIINPTMVSVAIEEGFEVPTLIKDLLVMEDKGTASRMFNQDFNVNVETVTKNKEVVVEEEYERKSKLRKAYNNNEHPAGIYLAYIPQDQRWLTTGDVDIYLLNHTEYDILYSMFLSNDEGKHNGIDYDVLQAEHKTHLTTIGRDELEQWSNGTIQALYHIEEKDRVLAPLNAEFKIKATRFYKGENYISSTLLHEKALLMTIGLLAENAAFGMQLTKKKIKEEEIELKPIKVVHTEPENILSRHMINNATAEVDLHIGELIEDYYLLDNSEMLRVQMDYFIKCLEAAFMNKLQKIIFIHGVGNGTLKTEIITILKAYENLHYFEASLSKYGVGATEIFLNTTK